MPAKKEDKFGLDLIEKQEEKVEVKEPLDIDFANLPEVHTVIRPLSLTNRADWENFDGEMTVRFLRQGFKLFHVAIIAVIEEGGARVAEYMHVYVKQ